LHLSFRSVITIYTYLIKRSTLRTERGLERQTILAMGS